MSYAQPCHYNHHIGTFSLIKNPVSGMVLDGAEKDVKLQYCTRAPTQLWTLEKADGVGKFFIVNKATGKVLDIEGGAKKGNNLITYAKHGGANQQWILNSDGSIVSAAENLAIDIKNDECRVGNNLIAWPKHGKDNQRFNLQC